MADDGLLIPIQFTLEEARAALNELEARARAAGQRTGEGLSGGVGKGLAGLKAQMGPARESAMFFSQALGEFGPQGRTAQIALSGVAGAIMGGGGVLAALSLAQVAARLLADAWGENEAKAKAAAAEAKKAAEEIALQLKEARERVQQEVFKLSETSASDIYKKTTLDPAVEAFKQMEAEVLGSAQRRAAARRAGDLDAFAAWDARMEAAKTKLGPLRKLAEEYQRTWELIIGQQELAASDKAAKDEKDKAAARRAAREKLAADEWAAAWQRQVEEAARLTAAEKAEYDRQVQMGADLWQLEVDRAAKLTALEQQTTAQRIAIQQEYENFMRSSAMDLANAVLGSFRPILTASAAYDRAMRASGKAAADGADLSGAAFAAMTQNFLANLALQAGSKAIFEMAEGYASAAIPGGQPAAALHFAAASNYGIVAGLAAAGAVAIGATRGMTAAERASVESGSSSAPSSGGSREYGGGATGGAGGTVTVRETVFIVAGSEFESPAETARRAARTLELVKKLDLERRAG